MKPLAQAYHDLATAYATSSSDELRITMNKSSETFIRDKNMGLVKQVLANNHLCIYAYLEVEIFYRL